MLQLQMEFNLRLNNTSLFLIVITAPSGAGKTTLCKKILENFPSLSLSISTTTRAPRGFEKNGVDYFFLTPSQFEEKITQNEFIEWTKMHGHFYGTSKKALQESFKQGRSIILDIDIQGAETLKKLYPTQCKSFFIAPPNFQILEQRLRQRGTDSEESIQKRLNHAKLEVEQGRSLDYWILNDSLERAYQEFKKILETQLSIKN